MKSGIGLARQESPRTRQSLVSTHSACHPISVSARRTVQCSKDFECSEKRLHGFHNYVIHVVQLVQRNHIRRKNVNNISKRTQKHAALQEKTIKLWTHRRKVSGILGS